VCAVLISGTKVTYTAAMLVYTCCIRYFVDIRMFGQRSLYTGNRLNMLSSLIFSGWPLQPFIQSRKLIIVEDRTTCYQYWQVPG